MISEAMSAGMVNDIGQADSPEPFIQGSFDLKPEALMGMEDDGRGYILTLSGPSGVSTTRLSPEDVKRGTFVIDISDIIAMDMPG